MWEWLKKYMSSKPAPKQGTLSDSLLDHKEEPSDVEKQQQNAIATSTWGEVKKFFALSEADGFALYQNFIRDFVWTWWSYQNKDYKGEVTTDANGQMYGQFAVSVYALSTAFLAYLLLRRVVKGSWNTTNEVLGFTRDTLAALAAIFTWDRGQVNGIADGAANDLSVQGSNYFASLFTGLAEGPTQYATKLIFNLLCMSEERAKYASLSAAKCFQKISFEGLLNTFPGLIPGANWNLVYMARPAGVSYQIGDTNTTGQLMAGSAAVAATVWGSNWIFGKTIEAAVNKFDIWQAKRGLLPAVITSSVPNTAAAISKPIPTQPVATASAGGSAGEFKAVVGSLGKSNAMKPLGSSLPRSGLVAAANGAANYGAAHEVATPAAQM